MFQNVIRWVVELFVVLSVPVVAANQMYGDAPADATEDEKEELRQKKIAFFNEESDKMLETARVNGTLPGVVIDLAKKFNDNIAGMLVKIANYHGYFGHKGNPPKAVQ